MLLLNADLLSFIAAYWIKNELLKILLLPYLSCLNSTDINKCL